MQTRTFTFLRTVAGSVVPVAGAPVYVYLPGGSYSMLAASDNTEGWTAANPQNTDDNGQVSIAAPNGTFDVRCEPATSPAITKPAEVWVDIQAQVDQVENAVETVMAVQEIVLPAQAATEEARDQAVQAGNQSGQSAAEALAYRNQAQSYSGAAQTYAQVYDTIALGRAAVADGAYFKVAPNTTDPVRRTSLFKRLSSTTQQLLDSYVGGSEFDTVAGVAAEYRWVATGLSSAYAEWTKAGISSTGELRIESEKRNGRTADYADLDKTQLATLTVTDLPGVGNSFLTPAQQGISWAATGLSQAYSHFTIGGQDATGALRLEYELKDDGAHYYASVEGASSGSGQVGSSVAPQQFDHNLRAGQSNEDGRALGTPTPVSGLIGKVYDYTADTIKNWVEPDVVISTANRLTRYGPFINEVYRRTGLGQLFTNGAEGGTPITPQAVGTGRPANEHWSAGGSLVPRLISRGKAAEAKAAASGIYIRGRRLHFTGTEADAAAYDNGVTTVTEQAIFDGFVSMIGALRDPAAFGPNLVVLIYMIGHLTSGDSPGYVLARAALRRVFTEIANVHPAYVATPAYANTTDYQDIVHWGLKLQSDSGSYGAVVASPLL